MPGIEGFNFVGVPLPKNQAENVSFETFCQDLVASYWHYHGACLVGKVVDGDLRAMGIKALHVVDSFTFPSTPASHPKRFYMMFGRYVGQKILQERSDQGEAGIWTS